MAEFKVRIESGKLKVVLGRLRSSLSQNEELMQQIAASQLLSVRRTFREQGVPAGSWVPLAPSTIRSNPKIYGSGHKLLVRSGRLLNSIRYQTRPGSVVIGTNLKYAAVHQFGSRDRSHAIGPKSKVESETTVGVKAHSHTRLSGELGVGHLPHAGRRKIQGPRNATSVNVRAHARRQNIPPRPYLVFRPEDPIRIRGIVARYVAKSIKDWDLGSGN